MYALERTHPNVRVLQARRLVQWGMWSMVAIMMDALHTVLSKRVDFDFFINLSDADLSLRTDAELRAFLARHKGRSFINVHGKGGAQLDGTGIWMYGLWDVDARARTQAGPLTKRMGRLSPYTLGL